jgi:hypothetical protein
MAHSVARRNYYFALAATFFDLLINRHAFFLAAPLMTMGLLIFEFFLFVSIQRVTRLLSQPISFAMRLRQDSPNRAIPAASSSCG